MWSRDWSSRSQVRDAALLSFIEVHAHPPKHLDHSKGIDLWFLESSTMRFRLRSLTSAFLTLFPSKYSVQYIKVYFKSSLSFYYAMENCAGAVLGQILSFFTLQLTYSSRTDHHVRKYRWCRRSLYAWWLSNFNSIKSVVRDMDVFVRITSWY